MVDINVLHVFFDDLVGDHNQFRPTKHFYEKTNINCKRFGLLWKGRKSPTFDELRRISDYFQVPLEVLTSKRQFKLEF